ncbi:hypothetical protein PWT90_10974 [Aphanocladium album]|nr:hypothetical protein PWT90_10974 [Aphanocladium album]
MPLPPTKRTMGGSKTNASGDLPKHRACDECRSRKLACTKEPDGCARCKREGIPCYYSPQKPMGRPRKRRPADDGAPQVPPASRRRTSPQLQRSRSASSSAPSSKGPEIQSFQLGATPAPSFGDAHLSFLDHQASTPDMAFFDLLPSYYQDGAALTPASQQPYCSSTQAFHGTLPMAHDGLGAYNDMSFLDPAFATASHSDGQDVLGATPDLSVGSHTPFNSEPSFSPPPHHTRTLGHSSSEEYAAAAGGAEGLRPLPTVSCPCLSSLYMALESLTNLPQSISAAMRVARHASKIAHSVITCKVCSCDLQDVGKPGTMQSFQNMMLLATLVPSACNAYTAIVEMIDRETHMATQQGRRIHFSLREVGAVWDVGGSPWLPADILQFDNTELEPHDWRRLLLAIIRLDVYGNREQRPSRLAGPPGTLGLSDVVSLLDERSSKRHELVDASIAAGTLPEHRHYMMTPRSCKPEDRHCVRILEVARIALNSLVLG